MKIKKCFKNTFFLFIFFICFITNAENSLRRTITVNPPSLDPHANYGVQTQDILHDLFEGLVATGINEEPVPGIAKKWEISEDGLTYTFYLRDSFWSDGTPVTAKDFVYSMQRAVNPKTKSLYSNMLTPIKNAEAIISGEEQDITKLGVEAINEHTLKIYLSNPTPYFTTILTHTVYYPVKSDSDIDNVNTWTNPNKMITNGPFKLESWTPQSNLTLTKSNTYWDKDNVKLDKVIFYTIEDDNIAFRRFQAGEIDWTKDIPTAQYNYVIDKLSDSYVKAPRLAVFYYGFDLTKPPFKNNLKLRKALSYAIDRDIIANKIMGTGEIPAYNFLPPGTNGAKPYQPDYANISQNERNKIAKQLYKEAGYSEKHPLELNFISNTNDNHKKVIVATAAMWKQVLGVKTNIKNLEWGPFLANLTEKQIPFDVYRLGMVGDYNDGNTFLNSFLSDSMMNYSEYNSPKYDELYAQTLTEQDAEKRKDIQNATEKELIDSFSVIPIYFYMTKRLINPKLKGYHINPMDISPSKYMYFDNEIK